MPGVSFSLRNAARSLAQLLSPLLAAAWNRWNRIAGRGEKALVLIGASYGRDLIRRLREDGRYVIIIDRRPEALNWRLANEAHFMDTFDLRNLDRVVGIARRNGVRAAFAQSDDRLIPLFAAVNNALGTTPIPEKAVRCSLSKIAMHEALRQAGVPAVRNAVLADASALDGHGVPYPLIVKADMGQGAHGYRVCHSADQLRDGFAAVRAAFPASDILVEQYLPGRQFDIEGIIHRGEVRPYIVTEENFFRHAPDFMRCWYLFNPGLDPVLDESLARIAKDALGACGFRAGAFHIEVRLDGEGQPYAIDLSNRMGADFPPSVRETTGRDMIGDYCVSMSGRDVPPPAAAQPRLELRYYTHAFEPNADRVAELARTQPSLVREDPGFDGDITMFVFMSESEAELRGLIGSFDALLGHD